MVSISVSSLAVMFVVGLMGAGHCVGMCGGIVTALGSARPGTGLLLGYNLGRILSYSLAGMLLGALSGSATQLTQNYLTLIPILRTFAAILLVLMGLYIADWWRILDLLEKAGQIIWRLIQPVAVRLNRPDNVAKAIMAGMLWGWLPCGLLYSALVQSLASGSALNAAAGMLAFGFGTMPAMLAASYFSSEVSRWLQARSLRRLMGLVLILMGIWMLWQLQGQPASRHH